MRGTLREARGRAPSPQRQGLRRRVPLAVSAAALAAVAAFGGSFDAFAEEIRDPPTPHFYYAFEKPVDGYHDRITVWAGDRYERKDCPVLEGKVLEWGTLVHFWDRLGGRRTYRREDLRKLEFRRDRDATRKPGLPDLTVAYIERLPRDPGWHGQVKYDLPGKRDLGVLAVAPEKHPLHPEPGQEVRFVVHVLNAGGAPTRRAFRYRVLMDESEIARGRVTKRLAPRDEETVEVPWTWEEGHPPAGPPRPAPPGARLKAGGQHHIKVELDTDDAVREIAEWNNTFVDPVRALTYFFAVSRDVVEGFAESMNCVDTYCFEDWAQYHVHMMNWLFQNSVYPSAPEGIFERVRVDRIIIAEDARDAEERKTWEPLRRRNGDVNDIIEYNGNWEFGRENDPEKVARWARRGDWGLPHELGHQLGLVDIYQLNTSIRDCLVRNRDGFYANVHHFFPAPRTMMHWHGPHLFSEQCAGYLNGTLGRPRGYFGDYLYALPKENRVRVLGNTGKPLAGVEIDLFQRNAGGPNHGRVGPEKTASGKTNGDGLFTLPNRPAPDHATWRGYELHDNPWGHVHVVGFNGMILARLRYAGYEEFHWLRIFDFNVAWFRGHRDEFTYNIATRFPAPGAPEPPRKLTTFWHTPRHERRRLELIWEPSPTPGVAEYRVYRKDSHGGRTVKPFTCYNIVPAGKVHGDGKFRSGGEYGGEFEFKGFYSKDDYFAVTAVGPDGGESGLSNTIYVPRIHRTNKLAVGKDGAVYISATGGDENQLLRWTPARGLHEFGLRTGAHRDYDPRFGGVAVDSRGRFVVADTWRHQLAVYTPGGDLVKLVGKGDRRSPGSGRGEFHEPADVAVDSRDRIYVADTRNRRVQVFDPEGEFLYDFGSGGEGPVRLEEPSAVGCVGDTLCVTDRKQRRVLVFDVPGEKPRLTRELRGIRDPGRALVSPRGMLHVSARDEEGIYRWAILVYLPDGRIHAKIRDAQGKRIEEPRGLCADGEGNAYFVTGFPPNVLNIRLQ